MTVGIPLLQEGEEVNAQGITPQMTAVADEVATGQVIDPLRVRITQDPHDPDAYTVHILPAQ